MKKLGRGECMLPEQLHQYVLDHPNDTTLNSAMSSNVDPSNSRERRSPPRYYSYHTTQYPSSLTPATFPDDTSETPTSHGSSEPPENEDDASSQDASTASFPSRNTGGDHPSPVSASSIHHGSKGKARSQAASEAAFNPIVHHSYTFPPPAPPFYAASSTRDWRDHEEGSSSRWSHGSREQLSPMERRRSADEGNNSPYDIPTPSFAYEYPSSARYEPPPTIQSRYIPDSTLGHGPPFTSSSHYGNDNALVSVPPHHGYQDPRFLRPPPHYPDSHYGRHHSAPLYNSEDWSRRASLSSLPTPGALQDSASSSKVVLPPVSHLLGTLGTFTPDNYDRGPVLPRLRLDLPLRESEDHADRGLPEATISPSLQSRGKRQRTDIAQETGGSIAQGRRAKVSRKIYVACDFCRACRYQDHPRRRGPGKAPKGSRSRKTETGRKGNKAAKQAESDTQSDMLAGSSSHFEPTLTLPEDDHSRPYMELRATYGPQLYTDRPSASNTSHDRYVLDSTPCHQLTEEAFNTSAEHFGSPRLSKTEGEQEENESMTELEPVWPSGRGDADKDHGPA
ncbi:hypothetical protein BS17DRAFT_819443 [Gyrodon lividus]|nr:hypothetical protein BS17DRAFT_819443 [Gyrodon lividus]